MKRIAIGITAFSTLVAFGIGWWLATQRHPEGQAESAGGTANDAGGRSQGAPSSAHNSVVAEPAPLYAAAEIARHATEGDCWIILRGKVYDVTSYLPEHPGGKEVLAAYCGRDGTNAFESRPGDGSPHSQGAQNLLDQYSVGDLKP